MPLTPSPAAAPRFVPTLTEVVAGPASESAPRPSSAPAASAGPTVGEAQATGPLSPAVTDALQEQITQRVLARVDAVLAGRLSDAIALVVLEQTRFMLPRLREEIAGSVRSAVSAALAQERDALQAQPGHGPA